MINALRRVVEKKNDLRFTTTELKQLAAVSQ